MPVRNPPLETLSLTNGVPVFLGVIVATTTINNHDTVVPFSNTGQALTGKVLLLQPSAACHVGFGTTNAVTVTTANGVKLAADQLVTVAMGSDDGWIACVGSASLRVWELT